MIVKDILAAHLKKQKLLIDININCVTGSPTYYRMETWTTKKTNEIICMGYKKCVGLHDNLLWVGIDQYIRINNGYEFDIHQKDKYSNNTTRPNIIVTTPNTEKPRLPSIKLIDKAKKKSPYSHGIFTNQFMRLKTDVNTTEKANNHVGIPNRKKFKSLRINDLFSTKMNKSHYNSTLVPYSSNIGNGNFKY